MCTRRNCTQNIVKNGKVSFSLSLFIALTHTHTHFFPPSFSLSLKDTNRPYFLLLFLSFSSFLMLCYFLSLCSPSYSLSFLSCSFFLVLFPFSPPSLSLHFHASKKERMCLQDSIRSALACRLFALQSPVVGNVILRPSQKRKVWPFYKLRIFFLSIFKMVYLCNESGSSAF